MSGSEKLTRIDKLLAELFRKKNWQRRLGLHAIFQTWPQVVGEEIARRAAPHVIRGDVLWVAVSDSVWMQQLHLQKQQLLEHINASLAGPEKISDIRFQIDAGLEDERPLPDSAKAASRRPLPLDQEKVSAFEGMIASVGDAETRGRLLSLWRKSQQYPSFGGEEER